MGKFTLKSNPEICKPNKTQRDRYNKIYPYLAYALRTINGPKTLFSSYIFSLGYMFKHLHSLSLILQMLT